MAASFSLLLCITALLLLVSNSNSTSESEEELTALLTFKKGADPNNILTYNSAKEDSCKFKGVECSSNGSITKYQVQNLNLQGNFPSHSLSKLTQLRIINLSNNSLSGPIPDLSPLINLNTLILDHNNFSGSFPLSVLILHRLVALSLDHNNLTGSLPARLTLLDRLISLHLESNHFSGLLPALNQTNLRVFDVSANNLNGPVPMTETLSRFKPASFAENPGLCGEIVQRQCPHRHSSVAFIVIIVILVVVFMAIVVIAVMKRKPVASGFGVLKQHMEMVRRGGS